MPAGERAGQSQFRDNSVRALSRFPAAHTNSIAREQGDNNHGKDCDPHEHLDQRKSACTRVRDYSRNEPDHVFAGSNIIDFNANV